MDREVPFHAAPQTFHILVPCFLILLFNANTQMTPFLQATILPILMISLPAIISMIPPEISLKIKQRRSTPSFAGSQIAE
jgi:hypothetical protein